MTQRQKSTETLDYDPKDCQVEAKSGYQLLVATRFYPPDYAPTGQLIEELCQELCQQGWHVHVFTSQPAYASDVGDAPRRERQHTLTIRRTYLTRLWPARIRGRIVNGLLYSLRFLVHTLCHPRRYRNHILLVTTEPPYLPVVCLVLKQLLGLSYVCLVYDLYPHIPVQLGMIGEKSLIARLWHFFNRLVWSQASKVIAISSSMRAQIERQYPRTADKMAVIPTWPDLNRIRPLPKAQNWFAQEHGLVERFTVLYSGNIGRCHDVDTIYATLLELASEPIQFVFIGHGFKYERLQAKVADRGLQNCLFLPLQDSECVPFSLTACDLSLVSIEKGMEGLVAPSKFYSYCAAGRPVAAICESDSYLHDILERTAAGRAFENGDHLGLADFIRTLLANPSEVQRMGRNARTYVESHHSVESIAAKFSQTLAETVTAPLG